MDYLDSVDQVDGVDGFHFLAKVRVAGSNPVVRSNMKPLREQGFRHVSGLNDNGVSCHHAHHSCGSARHEASDAVETGGVEGSIRQRGAASWELRVYAGIDRTRAAADTARRRCEATAPTPTAAWPA